HSVKQHQTPTKPEKPVPQRRDAPSKPQSKNRQHNSLNKTKKIQGLHGFRTQKDNGRTVF
ncbi:hypothetical protein, partial [Haematospirillum sp. H4890]|uniref:hypothetical protein n=1 Tax=Haematospirillum sp. H4890 TaxID=2723110 RepID=UPI001ADE9E2A